MFLGKLKKQLRLLKSLARLFAITVRSSVMMENQKDTFVAINFSGVILSQLLSDVIQTRNICLKPGNLFNGWGQASPK